jgi:hypothetical protein
MLFRVAALQHFAPVNDVIVGFLPGARIEKDGLAFDYTFEESQTGHDASNNFNRGKAFIMPRVLCDTANILRIRRFTGICRYRGGIRPVTLGYRCPTKVGGDELLSMCRNWNFPVASWYLGNPSPRPHAPRRKCGKDRLEFYLPPHRKRQSNPA